MYNSSLEENRRIRFAEKSWARFNWFLTPFVLFPSDRTSATQLKDERPNVPFLRDIIDRLAKKLDRMDIIIFTNSDICFVPEAHDIIMSKFKDTSCCFANRIDLPGPLKKTESLNSLRGREVYPGLDFIAFRKFWWDENRLEIPDFLIGCEGWDHIVKEFMVRKNPLSKIVQNIIYHELHHSFWEQHRFVNVGQKYNLNLTKKWLNEHGLPVYFEDQVD